jgi:hypothetical protein
MRENIKLILQAIAIILTIVIFVGSQLKEIESRLTRLETQYQILFQKGIVP